MPAFTRQEWQRVRKILEAEPGQFGLPQRRDDSVVLGSFNIRKLGKVRARSPETWRFLADVCQRFDLLAIQEATNDVEGLRHLLELMGPDFGLIASDATGAIRAGEGMQERLAFIFNWSRVARTEVASDVTYDRTKVLDTLSRRSPDFHGLLHPYGSALQQYEAAQEAYKAKMGPKPGKKPAIGAPLPTFLTFIRTPFQVSFEVKAKNGGKPYRFMAVNAHLNYGDYLDDRWQDFDGVMNWLHARVHDKNTYYPDSILFGDLNLDFDNPEKDRPRIEEKIKQYDQAARRGIQVNFPFLDEHPIHGLHRTNARMDQTFDQIGLFFRDPRYPRHTQNHKPNKPPGGPDYGMFNFVQLFAHALEGAAYDEAWSKTRKKRFFKRFEHEVSDHMPIWIRLPIP